MTLVINSTKSVKGLDKPKKMCDHAGEHHSKDIVVVWHGAPDPAVLCGFHNSQVTDYGKFPKRNA